ncbi:MAG: E3 ubiquitin protein ligase [Sphingobacteriaceae bacterium]|nr:MAG: E3 ubiquitin protein ligase [Sphingobacteriaceae bacterium]
MKTKNYRTTGLQQYKKNEKRSIKIIKIDSNSLQLLLQIDNKLPLFFIFIIRRVSTNPTTTGSIMPPIPTLDPNPNPIPNDPIMTVTDDEMAMNEAMNEWMDRTLLEFMTRTQGAMNNQDDDGYEVNVTMTYIAIPVDPRSEDVRVVLTDEAFSALKIDESDEHTTNQKCSVCLCEYQLGEQLTRLPQCQHLFHRECVKHWLTQYKRSCPNCRVLVEGESTALS